MWETPFMVDQYLKAISFTPHYSFMLFFVFLFSFSISFFRHSNMPSLLEHKILSPLEILKEFSINNSLVSVALETPDPSKLVLQALSRFVYFAFLNAAHSPSEFNCHFACSLLFTNICLYTWGRLTLTLTEIFRWSK